MGKTKDLLEDMRTLCIMPTKTYKDIKHLDCVFYLKEFDNSLRSHCKLNEEWQQLDYEYKKAREKKDDLEEKIWLNLMNKK